VSSHIGCPLEEVEEDPVMRHLCVSVVRSLQPLLVKLLEVDIPVPHLCTEQAPALEKDS
jgi:hypothetical protein